MFGPNFLFILHSLFSAHPCFIPWMSNAYWSLFFKQNYLYIFGLNLDRFIMIAEINNKSGGTIGSWLSTLVLEALNK